MEERETAVWICGGLKEIETRRRGRRWGLVRVSVVLLEKFCGYGL